LRKHLLALLNRKRPHRPHRIGDRRWQRCRERVVARLFVLPQLQLVIDGGAAALADLRVDQVDGEFMRRPARGDQLCGGFAGADTGITDTDAPFSFGLPHILIPGIRPVRGAMTPVLLDSDNQIGVLGQVAV
jgi:hypothetical protein